METRAMAQGDELIDQRALSKLKWRCRRGLLENDIFIDRFFRRFESTLTVKQGEGLSALMDLSDKDLLDLHLERKSLVQVSADAQVTVDLNRDDVREVLCMLRKPLER
jgi:antitoxin CptB